MPISLRWYCVQLHRHREPEAWNNLRRSFEAIVPLTPVERNHARTKRIVMAPMFPGYGFVRFDLGRPGWQRVWRTPGVVRIIGLDPERPTPVPDAAISELRALPKGADPRPHLAPLLIPEGASVAFLDGAWANHEGICTLSDDKRAMIAVMLFGRATEIEVRDRTQLRIIPQGHHA